MSEPKIFGEGLKHCRLKDCVECRLQEPLRVALTKRQVTYLKSRGIVELQMRLMKAKQTIARASLPLVNQAAFQTELTSRVNFQDIFLTEGEIEFRRGTDASNFAALPPEDDKTNIVALSVIKSLIKTIEKEIFAGNLNKEQQHLRSSIIASFSTQHFGQAMLELQRLETQASYLKPRSEEEISGFWKRFKKNSTQATLLPFKRVTAER